MQIENLEEEDLDERFTKSLSQVLEAGVEVIKEHLKLGEELLDNKPDENLIKKREFTHRKLIEEER